MAVLQNWSWPGNIRELENMIERMVILTKGRVLSAPPAELDAPHEFTDDNLTEMEREHIIRVLRETNGVLSGDDGAANRLGIKRTTLQSMLKRFGIEPHSYRRGTGTYGGEEIGASAASAGRFKSTSGITNTNRVIWAELSFWESRSRVDRRVARPAKWPPARGTRARPPSSPQKYRSAACQTGSGMQPETTRIPHRHKSIPPKRPPRA